MTKEFAQLMFLSKFAIDKTHILPYTLDFQKFIIFSNKKQKV